METHFCDRLRSCDRDRGRSQKLEPGSIFCDRLRSITIVRSYGNQSFAICDRNVSHNILNSDPWFNASLQQSNRLFVVNMAGVEQGNVSNEKFMEEAAQDQWVYHRNSKDFKDKNKKDNCWEKIGEKFDLSAAEAEFKFRNIRTTYGCYLKRLKTLPSGSGRDALPREFQNRLTKRRNKFAYSKISSDVRHIVCCDFPASTTRV